MAIDKLKKQIVYVLIMALVLSLTPNIKVRAQKAIPKTKAHAYYMIDAATGEMLLSKNANKKIYPASTVKLLTALVALEHAEETMEIKYTKKLGKGIPSDAAALNLRTGRTYNVNQYLHMLLMVYDAVSATV